MSVFTDRLLKMKKEIELVEQDGQAEDKISIGCGEIAAVQMDKGLPDIRQSFSLAETKFFKQIKCFLGIGMA